jgi:hypothetical protein
MSSALNGVTIYRLPPEDVEKFLATKYGGKIAAVNTAQLEKLSQKRAKYDAVYRNAENAEAAAAAVAVAVAVAVKE